MSGAAVLDLQGLSVDFRTREGTVHALENVSLTVGAGEFVGVVGESGSGKSVMAYAVAGILDRAARIIGGRAVLGGRDLLAMDERQRRQSRGREVAVIFQSPRTSLNPIRTVGRQIADVLRRRHHLDGRAARQRALELLTQVRITDPEKRLDAYPFALSGGMCQRVLIALALACDRIVVMHAGHVVEDAPTAALFARAHHPYTARLIAAVPARARTLADLAAIPGSLPDLRGALPPCRYSGRCERLLPACHVGPLKIAAPQDGRRVACVNPL